MISDSFSLILSLESSYIDIVALSLFVSVTATLLASIFSILSAAYLTINNFKLRNILMLIIHSLLALPPVVIGLVLYILFSNNGILSNYNLLYTVKIMIIAQVILITPILITLCKESFDYTHNILKEYLISIRASKLKQTITLIQECKLNIILNILVAFGRALSEVGAIIIVGGNISYLTRTMTTGIVVETSKGDLSMALSLGITLLLISLIINSIVYYFKTSLK
tara:strand:- start:100 stop:774 length:675 start_codon:yes stop_codon:yes gene_type:complete